MFSSLCVFRNASFSICQRVNAESEELHVRNFQQSRVDFSPREGVGSQNIKFGNVALSATTIKCTFEDDVDFYILHFNIGDIACMLIKKDWHAEIKFTTTTAEGMKQLDDLEKKALIIIQTTFYSYLKHNCCKLAAELLHELDPTYDVSFDQFFPPQFFNTVKTHFSNYRRTIDPIPDYLYHSGHIDTTNSSFQEISKTLAMVVKKCRSHMMQYEYLSSAEFGTLGDITLLGPMYRLSKYSVARIRAGFFHDEQTPEMKSHQFKTMVRVINNVVVDGTCSDDMYTEIRDMGPITTGSVRENLRNEILTCLDNIRAIASQTGRGASPAQHPAETITAAARGENHLRPQQNALRQSTSSC